MLNSCSPTLPSFPQWRLIVRPRYLFIPDRQSRLKIRPQPTDTNSGKMQSVALFSNSSSPLNIPLCLRALFTPSRMKGAEGQFARPLCAFFQQISAAPFTLLALDSWQREWPGKIQPVFKKREKEKGVGKREGCATWFRVLYPCVSCEEGWMGIKESRKMNVSHEHHSFVPGRFHSFTFHPSPALFLSRASVLHACPFEWKLVSNHRGIPLD